MAISLQAYGRFSVRVDGQTVNGGSIEKPSNIQVDGTVHQKIASIANGSSSTVYSDELGTFNFMHLASDFNTRIVFTDTGSNSFSLQLRGTGIANQYGIPLMLGLDETVNSNVTINSAVAYNVSGNTAKVICIAVK